MKKIYTIFALLLTMMISGCGSDNSYDGVTGLPSGEAVNQSDVDTLVRSIYQDIILKDINTTHYQSLLLLQSIQDLNESNTTAALLNAQEKFKTLVSNYKRVETLYVAGYYSDDMRDIAEFNIEQYIKGSKSQDTAGDLESVFAGNKTIVINALKGMTALEYTLFGDAESLSSLHAKINQNRLDAALLMANTLVTQFEIVQTYYLEDSTFYNSSDDAISALLNVLVTSSYTLRETRVGDAAGYTAKYQNNPDSRRLEYYYSTNSLEAIKEILKTQQRVMEGGLSAIATLGNATSEAEAITTAIEEALTICNAYNSSLESALLSPNTLELYEKVRTIQNNYTALINGLNFTQKLIEADGD